MSSEVRSTLIGKFPGQLLASLSNMLISPAPSADSGGKSHILRFPRGRVLRNAKNTKAVVFYLLKYHAPLSSTGGGSAKLAMASYKLIL